MVPASDATAAPCALGALDAGAGRHRRDTVSVREVGRAWCEASIQHGSEVPVRGARSASGRGPIDLLLPVPPGSFFVDAGDLSARFVNPTGSADAPCRER